MSEYLFDSSNLQKVRDLLRRRPLGLAVDVDGTLSEIVARPDEAVVRSGCKQALSALVHRLDLVAAISGRPAAQTRAMVDVEGMVYAGVHGLERWENGKSRQHPEAAAYRAAIQKALAALTKELDVEGVIVENKGISVAIHFRNAPWPDAARQAILRAIDESGVAAGLRVVEGKKVIEIRPPVRYDKGWAVCELVEAHGLAGIIYLGDDLTDVDAFAALRSLRAHVGIGALSVGVLGLETPPQVAANADLVLCGVADVEKFLTWLAQEPV